MHFCSRDHGWRINSGLKRRLLDLRDGARSGGPWVKPSQGMKKK